MRVAGKTHCHGHSRPALGYLRPRASGSSTQPRSLGGIVGVLELDFAEVALEPFDEASRQHGATAVLASLAVADADLEAVEVDVLDPEGGALHEPEARAVQDEGHQPGYSVDVLEQGSHLLGGEHDRDALGALGTDEGGGELGGALQDVRVQKEQRRERLILRRGADALHAGEVGEERRNLVRPQRVRVAHAVELQEAADPAAVGFLGSRAVVSDAERSSDAVEELRLRSAAVVVAVHGVAQSGFRARPGSA